jgi:hypothetical protein
MPTQGVEEARKAVNLEYPLNNPDEYKGRLVFTVLFEPPSDLSSISSAITDLFLGDEDDGGVVSGNKEEALQTAEQTLGKLKNLPISGDRAPQRTNRQVSVFLPLGLQYRDNVAYENMDLGALGGAAELGMKSGANALSAMIDAGAQTLAAGFKGSAGSALTTLGATKLLAKVPGLGDELGGAAKVAGRVTTNPNTRVLFKQVNLREFAFTFKFIPTSQKEAEEVKQIVKFFRTELYPEDIEIDVGQSKLSVGYKFPNKFAIDVVYDGEEVATKIKPCYLRDVGVTYNNTAMSMHSDGNFSEVEMTLAFQETRTLNRKDVEEGGF